MGKAESRSPDSANVFAARSRALSSHGFLTHTTSTTVLDSIQIRIINILTALNDTRSDTNTYGTTETGIRYHHEKVRGLSHHSRFDSLESLTSFSQLNAR